MRILYDVAIRLYGWSVWIAALAGNSKARLWVDGRKDWKKKLAEGVRGSGPWVWFHCASLGEFEQGRPVLEAYRQRYPEKRILLTFYSPSGYEIRKNYPGADLILYLPLDTADNAAVFLDVLKPECVFLIKYEFWFNLLRALNRREIPVYLVSCIFRKKQWFFRPVARPFLNELRKARHFFVQDTDSVNLLSRHGIQQATVSGDTRFDRVASIAAAGEPIAWLEKWKNTRQLLVAGSTWPKDEELLLDLVSDWEQAPLLLVVPHEIGEEHLSGIERQLERRGLEKVSERLSAMKDSPAATTRIVLVDRIGLLSRMYRYATLAYVGGGFGAGIHNTLEAAVYGIPVLFGPNFSKFNEAKGLIEAGAAKTVHDLESFSRNVRHYCQDQNSCSSAGRAADQYVNRHTGATKLILNQL